MIIYSKNDKYTIFANTKDRKFYAQIEGKEVEKEGYNTAAIAISKTHDKLKAEEVQDGN